MGCNLRICLYIFAIISFPIFMVCGIISFTLIIQNASSYKKEIKEEVSN